MFGFFVSLNTDLCRPEIFEIVSHKLVVTAEANLDGLVGVDTKMRGYARRTVCILSTRFYERFFCMGLPDEKDRFLVGLYQTPTLLLVFSYRREATVIRD
jgi:hypothetical protein